MSENYIPPEGTSIPFVFSKAGYTIPENIVFNFVGPGKFGILKAAVNVMQPYWYHTYTYPKSCPKYVVGYSLGRVQIIRGRCIYGGIRDLRGYLKPWPMQNFPAEINGVLWHGSDQFQGILRPWHREIIGDIPGYIHGWQELDLSAIVAMHPPRNLEMFVRVNQREISDLSSHIHGWQEADLGLHLAGTHFPVELPTYVHAQQRSISDMSSFIHAWHERYLQGVLGGVTFNNLQGVVDPIPAIPLHAYLKVWPQNILPAYTRGWGALDLTAYLNQMYSYDLPAHLIGVSDTLKNLRARIKGWGSELSDMPGFIRVFHWQLFGGIIRATYLANINAYLFPVLPKYLKGLMHVWHERYLQGIIGGQQYPWNLTATINPTGVWHLLQAIIAPVAATGVYDYLIAMVHPWERRDFPAYIYVDRAAVLSAYLNTLGYSSDLHATIRPKMIRLTTIVNIPTFSHKDLSAIINFPCKKTGYATLMAQVYSKYKGDLYAFIRPIIYDYKPSLLGAKIGYTDGYLEVDKFKLSITLFPSEFFTRDMFRLAITLLDSKVLLAAYIKGILTSNNLTANVVGDEIPSYTYDTLLKNRERVIHKTYDGVFQQFEVVELAFKSAVKDYYYSSAGDYAWKTKRFDKWMLDVRSILPEDQALHLKRRLHRATTLYDLKKFVSIDEALRFAIAYVTEQPTSNLSASLFNRARYLNLPAVINPRYVRTAKGSLPASISPSATTIVVGKSASILKM